MKIKKILKELVDDGFFDTPKTSIEVIKKLSARGFTLKGRQIGAVNRQLTLMCRDSSIGLEREKLSKEQRIGQEKWRYKRVKKLN